MIVPRCLLLFAFYSTTPSGKREKRGDALKSASDDDDAELSRAPYAFSQHVYWIDEPLFRPPHPVTSLRTSFQWENYQTLALC